jgi:hypothetical protein
MLETIEQAIKPHDNYQIEMKLDYQLVKGQKTHYRVSTFFFVPQSLGIDAATYIKSDFYRDIQTYIRLKTPTLILREFTENSASPLVSASRICTVEGWTNKPECRARLINSFKLLAAMLKSSYREHLNLIHRRIAEAAPDSKIHVMIRNLVDEFLIETQKITKEFRSLYPVVNLPNVDDTIFAAYKFTDESISLLIEESAADMSVIVGDHLKKADRIDFNLRLCELVKHETTHRKSHGYPSILSENSDNEEYEYRTSVLKKYAASVLYLSTAVHREGTTLEQVLFAVAAGVSMGFATVIAFYFQRQYGNFTVAFFVALVVGYMFKDRMKESGRGLFAKYLQNTLYDRRITIRSQDGQHKLGILREKVSFVDEQDVPRPVLKARNLQHIANIDNDWRGERIIRYAKEIVLYKNAFDGIFGDTDTPQLTGINDIMRYDIRSYLRKMAEPLTVRRSLNCNELRTFTCHKVYHLDVVSRYRSIMPHKEKIHRRVRLVLDRKGIKRIEHIDGV